MNGFGFIEYDNPLDARDVVPGMRALQASPSKIYTNTASSQPTVCVLLDSSCKQSSISLTYHGTQDGSDMSGSRLTVQFARGSRQRDFPAPDRTHPRPRRTAYRMQISGLPGETSWQVSSLPLPSVLVS